jgi:hypothetical protein
MRRVYYYVRATGFWIVLISTIVTLPFLLLPYFVLRYLLVERFSHEQIVYLRSFRYSETKSAFGGIVSKVASRYGVLAGLAHETQRPSEIHEKTRLTDRGNLAVVSNEMWRNWVENHLKKCSAVIIDHSVGTESLDWEVQRARDLVDHSRIAILAEVGSLPDKVSDVWFMEYTLGKYGEKEARKMLKSWFDRFFFESGPL